MVRSRAPTALCHSRACRQRYRSTGPSLATGRHRKSRPTSRHQRLRVPGTAKLLLHQDSPSPVGSQRHDFPAPATAVDQGAVLPRWGPWGLVSVQAYTLPSRVSSSPSARPSSIAIADVASRSATPIFPCTPLATHDLQPLPPPSLSRRDVLPQPAISASTHK